MKRVVITGIGAVTPIGNDAESMWESMIAGMELHRSHTLIQMVSEFH